MESVIITLGFVSAKTLESTMNHLYEANILLKPHKHYFLYQHYPLSKEKTKISQLATCEKYGMIWVDSGFDRGLHNGMNYLMGQLNLNDDDIVIGLDPDEWPITRGFDQALEDALTDPNYPDMVISYLRNSTFPPVNYSQLVGGHRAYVFTESIAATNVAAFKAGWFKQIGGWWEPTTHYGYLEVHINSKIQETKKTRCVLEDVRCVNVGPIEGYVPQDELYRQYKGCQANWTSKESFEDWLKKNGRGEAIIG